MYEKSVATSILYFSCSSSRVVVVIIFFFIATCGILQSHIDKRLSTYILFLLLLRTTTTTNQCVWSSTTRNIAVICEMCAEYFSTHLFTTGCLFDGADADESRHGIVTGIDWPCLEKFFCQISLSFWVSAPSQNDLFKI